MGRPFCKNLLILVKCLRDSRQKSDCFRCKKISQKLKYLNFNCELRERYFFFPYYSFHHSAHVPCEKFGWRQAKSVSGNQALRVLSDTRKTKTKGETTMYCSPDCGKFFETSYISFKTAVVAKILLLITELIYKSVRR